MSASDSVNVSKMNQLEKMDKISPVIADDCDEEMSQFEDDLCDLGKIQIHIKKEHSQNVEVEKSYSENININSNEDNLD